MGVLPMASPGFAQGHRSIFHSSENTRNSPGMRKWLSMPHTKYLWAASGSYAPWDSPVFFLYFFFSGYEYDAAIQFNLETRQTLVQEQGLVAWPWLWLHPQTTRKLSFLVPARTGCTWTSFITIAIEALRISRTERSTMHLAGWD